MMRSKDTSLRCGLSALATGILSSVALAQSLVTKTDSTPGFFDQSSGIRSFLVTAADMVGGAAVNRVTIAIDFEKYAGPTLGVNGGGSGLPWYNEIEFKLTNPQNITTSLIAPTSFNPGSTGFRGVITFDDFASSFVDADPDTLQAGTFKPTGPGTLADLNSVNGVGTWKLSIRDTTATDHLGYYSSTLTLNPVAAPALTPEMPAGVQVIPILLAVGGMALYQRKKKSS